MNQGNESLFSSLRGANDMAENQGRQGWGFPAESRKAHYFIIEPGHNMGDSLCRGYVFYGGPTEQGNDNSPDNCIRCKKLKKIMDGKNVRT